jgi:putative ABC transport system permease protein
MAALGVFVTVFIVSSTFALAAAQRRRELGLLRTVGATGRQIRRLVLGEALVVGAVAAGIGVVAGIALTPVLARLLHSWGLEPFPGVPIKAWPIPVAWLIGVAVAVLGAWSASRRAGSVGPLEVLREASVQRRLSKARLVFGALAAAGGAWLAFATAGADASDRVDKALFTTCVLIVAAALLAPVLVRPMIWLVTWPLRGPAGMVVRAEMLNALRRTASLMAPVIATVGFTVMLTGMVTTMMSAYPAGKTASLKGMTVVVPDGTLGLSDAAVAAAGAGESSLIARISVGDKLFYASGTNLPSDSIAIGGYQVGSLVPVAFADGETVSLRVVESTGPDAVIARELVRQHDSSALTPEVMGGSVAGPGAKVLDAKAYADDQFGEESRLIWLFAIILIGLSVGYTGLAILNTMGMATSSRRDDLEVLRTAGATARQVFRFLMLETALVVGAGTVLGLAVTVPPLLAMARGLEEETETPVSLALHWPSLTVVVAMCLAVSAVGVILNLRARRVPS